MSARNHHYLSQFYLRGFTDPENGDGLLQVVDQGRRNTFRTNPRNVAAVNHFNRIEADGLDPNVLENELSHLEGAAAEAWTRVHGGSPLEGEDRELILTMAALQHVRTPGRRELWRQTRAHTAEIIMGMALASEETWNAHVRRARETGENLPNVSYIEAKQFYDEKAYRIELSRESQLHKEFLEIDVVLPMLLARNWVLLRTDPLVDPFITSDQPVHLAWINPQNVPPAHRDHPGHGFKDTRVWFPLSSELVAVGEFDGPKGERHLRPDGAAIVNHMTMRGARDRLYATSLDFRYLTSEGRVHDGHHLVAKLKEQPSKP